MISVSAIEAFFDFNKPCPKEIKMCKQLRTEYKLQIGNSKNCTECGKRLVKNIYINKIMGK